MGETIFHLSIPVREALAADDATLRFFLDDHRAGVEIRADLVIALAKGHVWAPCGPCDNFDPAAGCRGHERDAFFTRLLAA
jgi:hypothetical protein